MRELIVVPTLPINYNTAPSFFEDGLSYYLLNSVKTNSYLNLILATGEFYSFFKFKKDSAIGLIVKDKYTTTYLIKKIREHGFRILLEPNLVHFYDSWTSNHYHFIVEFLPRLLKIEKEELERSTILLPDTDYIRNVGVKLLKLFAFHPKKILFISEKKVMFSFRMKYISKLIHSGTTDPFSISKLRDRIVYNTPHKSNLLVYVKRGDKYGRKVLNERELELVLEKKYGFSIIEFDNLSLDEANFVMRNTKVLMSMHGAALTNMIFMPAGSSVVEFRYDGPHHNHCYWHLASACQLNYLALFGESDDSGKMLEGQGCNLTIPISVLEELVEILI